MPVAVVLRLDGGAEAALARLGKRLVYPPHITLLRAEDAAEAALARAMPTVEAAPVDLVFASFGLFPGPPVFLFLAPVVTPALLALHMALAAAVPDRVLHPHVRPGAWVPHATLAEGAVDLDAALARWTGPIAARGLALELVRFPPPVVLARRDLPAG
ncbi:2'-5' RNA ligase family protein [Falsiroseomonas tokyonensis]|uniref:2'-5' RNA ligase family protein n=1 Tax=Falsiroseomonas tokyonensis TaxID=430521 RepID=A0ABV7BRI8_9PROT|nr:2'-5' RNA ligase family protein [Falsiroseomonas tokyonensis]MBU8538145.1 2'-5' RNA ligase family protein [Falsiroseomonas tokyonensis]